MKCFLILILVALGSHVGQTQVRVKFAPYGVPEYCKGCGHLGSDFWKVRFRLENISGSELIVYGTEVDSDRRFRFLNQVQHRNPNVCEWQYGPGEPTRRVAWRNMPKHEQVPRVLKPGETLEDESGIHAYDNGIPTRLTAFVGLRDGTEPVEVFSSSYRDVTGSMPNERSYEFINDSCSPQCKVGTPSPVVRGIRLGMTLKEFRTRFPYVKIDRLYRSLFNYKTAYVSDWDWDAHWVRVTFVDDKVERIEPTLRSLKKSRGREDYWELISSRIGLPYFRPPYQLRWECSDFVVEVTPNEDPTITIQTKNYLKVRDRLNEEALKKIKLR